MNNWGIFKRGINMKRQKWLVLIVCITYILSLTAPVIAADVKTEENRIKIDIKAESAILMDANTGQILYSFNENKKWYPASMTKLMTLIVAIEAVKNGQASFEDEVVTSENAASYGGSQLYLEPGEKFSLWEMLTAVIIASANDASVAVAEHIAGSEEAFVDLMNKKAKEIGCQNTHFVNSHGLHDDNHYTTALDMAKIARYSLKFPETLKLTSLKYHKFRDEPKTERYSLNKLLWWYPGADGFKTGTTSIAKRNLVSTCKRDGLRLIAVVMGAEERRGHFTETMKLLNTGYRMYAFKEFYSANYEIGEVAVGKGSQDTVKVITGDTVGLTILKGREKGYETKVVLPSLIQAPISKGQPVGEVIVMKDDKEIKRFPVVTAEKVEKGSIFRMIGKVLKSVYAL
ncbi:MAG: hypothetical protein PWQ96_315 [Clostridia bacterium]|nr:hypothetical protein [Clostridia bacterium]